MAMNQKFLRIAVLVLCSGLGVLFTSHADAVGGKYLRIFTTNAPIMEPVIREFERTHSGMQVAYETRAKGNEVRSIMRLELSHGRYFDVALLNLNQDAVNLVHEFRNKGFVPFLPPQAPLHPLNDPARYWTAVFGTRYVLAYNTRAILSRAPNFKDLMDGTYEFILDPQNFGWFEGLDQCLGEAASKDFLQKLSRGKLMLRKGNSVIAMLVVAGEAPIGMTIDHIVTDLQKRGAPIAWNPDADPVIARFAVVLLGQGPNQEGAKKFIQWLLSAAGQGVIEAQGVLGARRAMKRGTCILAPQDVSSDRWKVLYDEYRKILNIR